MLTTHLRHLRIWGRDAPSAQPFAPVFLQVTFEVFLPNTVRQCTIMVVLVAASAASEEYLHLIV